MPNNLHATPTVLIDIEPPDFLDPSSLPWEGLAWLETTVFVLILSLIIASVIGLLIWRSRLYCPVLLYWKLSHITPQKNHPKKETVSRKQVNLLYQYCLEMQTLNASPLLHSELSTLIEQIKPLCFAKEEVSRETYLTLLSQAKHQLKQRLKPTLCSLLNPKQKAP